MSMNTKKKKSKLLGLVKFVVIVALIIGALSLVKLNYLRPLIEKQVSKSIDKKFEIRGDLKLIHEGMYPGISVNEMYLDNEEVGSYDVIINPYVVGLDVHKISGKLGEGVISGNASYIKNKLVANFDFNNMSYSKLTKDMDGKYDLKVRLSSEGSDANQIKSNLAGNILLLGGKGKLNSSALKLWGADLVTSALQSVTGKSSSLKLNCAVADVNIDKGVASFKAAGLDTDELVLNLKGIVNIGDSQLNIKVIPEPRIETFVNLATPVKVKGSFDDIQISTDAVDVAKKIGTTVLTKTNPIAAVIPFVKKELEKNTESGKESICNTYMGK